MPVVTKYMKNQLLETRCDTSPVHQERQRFRLLYCGHFNSSYLTAAGHFHRLKSAVFDVGAIVLPTQGTILARHFLSLHNQGHEIIMPKLFVKNYTDCCCFFCIHTHEIQIIFQIQRVSKSEGWKNHASSYWLHLLFCAIKALREALFKQNVWKMKAKQVGNELCKKYLWMSASDVNKARNLSRNGIAHV